MAAAAACTELLEKLKAGPNAGQLVKRPCAMWGHNVEGNFTN